MEVKVHWPRISKWNLILMENQCNRIIKCAIEGFIRVDQKPYSRTSDILRRFCSDK